MKGLVDFATGPGVGGAMVVGPLTWAALAVYR